MSVAALDKQPSRCQSQRQFLLDARSLRAPDELQMQGGSGQHLEASLQYAARGANTGFVLIKALRRTVLAHSHIHAIRPITVLIVEKHQVDIRSSLVGRAKPERDFIVARQPLDVDYRLPCSASAAIPGPTPRPKPTVFRAHSPC